MRDTLQRVLVTGASGFLGRAIVQYFSSKGLTIFGTDRVAPENAPLLLLSEYASITLPDPYFESLLLKWKPQVIIHCAGRASVPQSMQNPAEDYQQGPVLTFYVLDAIRRLVPNCSFLLLSSAAVYGNPVRLPVNENDTLQPVSAYGFHKWQSELICREFSQLYSIPSVSARIFSAYGVGLRRQVMWDIAYKALTQKEIILQGTGLESRDFIHAHDIALALDMILSHAPMQGEAYNVGSGEETTITELTHIILNALERKMPVNVSDVVHPGTPLNWRADISRIKYLGYNPKIPLLMGIQSFLTWCRQEISL